MDMNALCAAAAQLPFLGVFVWFALKLYKDAREERVQRDQEWREFLKEERVNRQSSMGQGLQAMGELSKITQEMIGQLVVLRETEKEGQQFIERMNQSLKTLVEQHADENAPFSTVKLHTAAKLFVQLQHELAGPDISDETKRILRDMETALS